MTVVVPAAWWEDAPLDESRAPHIYAASCRVCGAVQRLRLDNGGFMCAGEHDRTSSSIADLLDETG